MKERERRGKARREEREKKEMRERETGGGGCVAIHHVVIIFARCAPFMLFFSTPVLEINMLEEANMWREMRGHKLFWSRCERVNISELGLGSFLGRALELTCHAEESPGAVRRGLRPLSRSSRDVFLVLECLASS